MTDSLEGYVEKINQWGIDRNITPEGGATAKAQMEKAAEEMIEWFIAYGENSPEDRVDAFGDILVCLIQAMRLSGVTMEYCLSIAWAEIKDRKGTMIKGKFVKEDLCKHR